MWLPAFTQAAYGSLCRVNYQAAKVEQRQLICKSAPLQCRCEAATCMSEGTASTVLHSSKWTNLRLQRQEAPVGFAAEDTADSMKVYLVLVQICQF